MRADSTGLLLLGWYWTKRREWAFLLSGTCPVLFPVPRIVMAMTASHALLGIVSGVRAESKSPGRTHEVVLEVGVIGVRHHIVIKTRPRQQKTSGTRLSFSYIYAQRDKTKTGFGRWSPSGEGVDIPHRQPKYTISGRDWTVGKAFRGKR